MFSAAMISQILLWLAVLVLLSLVLALARQVGVLHERIAPAGALAMNSVLKVGEALPLTIEADIEGAAVEIGGESSSSTLVYFMSPDCPICKSLLPALISLVTSDEKQTRLVFASDGNVLSIHKDYVNRHNLSQYPYIVSERLGQRFGVSKLPYAVLLDESGAVMSLGMVNTREHLESLFTAKAMGVSSIQDFLARKKNNSRIGNA